MPHGWEGGSARGSREVLASRARLWWALTLPLRLCTLKAMLGDMSSSSDSCSESFFFSLSMALLPLFALCGERQYGPDGGPDASPGPDQENPALRRVPPS